MTSCTRGFASCPLQATPIPVDGILYFPTHLGRVIALDAATGRPCAGYGEAGRIDLVPGVAELAFRGEFGVTSPPRWWATA